MASRKNSRRRHFRPPSTDDLLFKLLHCFYSSRKDLNLTEAQQKKRRRHLSGGCLTNEDETNLLKGLQKAEGIRSESNDWPPWFSHHLSWIRDLYQAVLNRLPKGTRIHKKDFVRFLAFNLAAPLGASALNRFHQISESASPIVMGHRSVTLLGLNFNPIPLSAERQDLPFASAMRSLRQAKFLKNPPKGKSRWMNGVNIPDAYELEQYLEQIKDELEQALRINSEKCLQKKIRQLRKHKKQLLEQGQDSQSIQKQIKAHIGEAKARYKKETPDALFQGFCARLRFLAGVQRVLLLAEKKMKPSSLHRDLLNDLSYWFHVPQNDQGLQCDGIWVNQPDCIVVEKQKICVSKYVYPKAKPYLDWLARYGADGALSEHGEISKYAEHVSHCLSGKG